MSLQLATGTYFAQNAGAISEALSTKMWAEQQNLESLLSDIPIVTAGVNKLNMGRGFEYISWVKATPLVGNISLANRYDTDRNSLFGQDNQIGNAANGMFRVAAPSTSYTPILPGGGNTNLPESKRMAIHVNGFDMNLEVPVTLLEQDQQNAVVQQLTDDMFQGWARNCTRRVFQEFWLDIDLQRRLSLLGTASFIDVGSPLPDGTNAVVATITFTTEQIHRFYKGMQVDLWTVGSSGTSATFTRVNQSGSPSVSNATFTNRVPLMVVNVIPDTKTVWLGAPQASDRGGTAATLASVFGSLNANMIITEADSWTNTGSGTGERYISGLYGLHSWGRTSGPLLGAREDIATTANSSFTGNVLVENYPSLRSATYAVNGVLTENILLRVLNEAENHNRQYGCEFDTVFTRYGVWQAYYENNQHKASLDRTGVAGSLRDEGAEGGLKFRAPNGRTYNFELNYQLEEGRVYFLKMANNWKIVAPNLMNMKTAGPMGSIKALPIDFWGTKLGFPSATLPVLTAPNGGGVVSYTDYVQYPARMYCQFVAEYQPRMLTLTGCTENRVTLS